MLRLKSHRVGSSIVTIIHFYYACQLYISVLFELLICQIELTLENKKIEKMDKIIVYYLLLDDHINVCHLIELSLIIKEIYFKYNNLSIDQML